MSALDFTPEQIELVIRYGKCLACGYPREHYAERDEHEARSGLRCSNVDCRTRTGLGAPTFRAVP